MDAISTRLRQVRGWFIAWFVVQSVIGTAVAVAVLSRMRLHPVLGYALDGVTPEFTAAAAAAGCAVVLGLALVVFSALEERRQWARIVLLVVGWITAVGAGLDLLTVTGYAALLGPALGMRGTEWQLIQAATLLTKGIDLAFWSWVIVTLQFTPAVRGAFACEEPPARTGAERD